MITGSLLWNSAYAGLVPSNKVPVKVEINAESILNNTSVLRSEISRGLSDESVLLELSKLGIKKSEVQMRLAAMSDQELQQVQQGVDRQVGGDVVVISVTALLLIIIAVMLLMR